MRCCHKFNSTTPKRCYRFTAVHGGRLAAALVRLAGADEREDDDRRQWGRIALEELIRDGDAGLRWIWERAEAVKNRQASRYAQCPRSGRRWDCGRQRDEAAPARRYHRRCWKKVVRHAPPMRGAGFTQARYFTPTTWDAEWRRFGV